MIKLQVKELCVLRGIKAPIRAIMKAGMSQQITYDYFRGEKKNLSLKHIEMLCRLLGCTPNDLFAWTPDSKADDYPENPLQVIRQKPLPDLQKVIGSLSLEEVRKRLEGK